MGNFRRWESRLEACLFRKFVVSLLLTNPPLCTGFNINKITTTGAYAVAYEHTLYDYFLFFFLRTKGLHTQFCSVFNRLYSLPGYWSRTRLYFIQLTCNVTWPPTFWFVKGIYNPNQWINYDSYPPDGFLYHGSNF